MSTQTSGARFSRVRPVGQSLVTGYPRDMPPKFAERSARALLARQPRRRFPDYQQFGFTDDHRLVISGLGHDLEAIRKFDKELQGYWFRAWSRAKHGTIWPGTRLDRMRFRQDERRDKWITLALVGLLAVLFAVEAIADDVRPDIQHECETRGAFTQMLNSLVSSTQLPFSMQDCIDDETVAFTQLALLTRSQSYLIDLCTQHEKSIQEDFMVQWVIRLQATEETATKIHGSWMNLQPSYRSIQTCVAERTSRYE